MAARDDEIVKRIREVEDAHRFDRHQQRCSCGEELRSYNDHDAHFTMALYAAAHADGVSGRRF